jgi:DMSO/TMAO reductase YedYZ molybdopterin-dependent catalytic subunit
MILSHSPAQRSSAEVARSALPIMERVFYSRRRFLSAIGASGLAVSTLERLVRAAPLDPLPGGRLLGTMPLGRFDGRPAPELGRVYGSGLDARRFTDLATLRDDSLVTPIDRFFVRTTSPPVVRDATSWTIRLGGGVRRPLALTVDALARDARAMGPHLMECSGNSDPANFGLMSAAEWTGVPLAAVLDRMQSRPGRWRVRVTGLDDESQPSRSSVAGASWIFARDDLDRSDAFLATSMNGVELPRDHGWPVRLVVPNWYGCACIKWVSGIDLVPDAEPATAHMREFAGRTHQQGVPERARDFAPPTIDLAAVPVRVEQWAVGDRLVYRVVGVRWGGTSTTCALRIRFKHTQPFVPVDACPPSAAATTWSLWWHVWRPEYAGRYSIVLRPADPAIAARRLDLFFYTRDVDIDRV